MPGVEPGFRWFWRPAAYPLARPYEIRNRPPGPLSWGRRPFRLLCGGYPDALLYGRQEPSEDMAMRQSRPVCGNAEIFMKPIVRS